MSGEDELFQVIAEWRGTLDGAPSPDCPVCRGSGSVIVAGPDENGQYDADDCPCQVDPDFDPSTYCEHGVPDNCDCQECL